MQPKYRVIWKLGKFRKHKTIYKYTQEQIATAQKQASRILASSNTLLRHTATGLVALFVKYNDKEYILK